MIVTDSGQHVARDPGPIVGCRLTGEGHDRVEGEIVLNRPVEEVFDFVADAPNEPRYNPRMLHAKKLTPGPIGLGTQFRDEIKSMGRPAEITIEIIDYERPWRPTNSIHMSAMDVREG